MYQRLVVPLDGSPPAQRAFDEAIGLAREGGGRLLLLHVAQIPLAPNFSAGLSSGDDDVIYQALVTAGKDALKTAQAKAEAAGVAAESQLLGPQIDAIAPSIIEAAQAWNADLIVMGTHGRRGFDHLMLGSVAERVLRIATVPVLMVRQAT
jgi:nucleotide-binding universal stress UspA family protein